MMDFKNNKGKLAASLLALGTLYAINHDDAPGFSMTEEHPVAVIGPVAGGLYQQVELKDGRLGYRLGFGEEAYSSNVCIADIVNTDPVTNPCLTSLADKHYMR